MNKKLLIAVFIIFIASVANTQTIKEKLDMFKQVKLTADLSRLSDREKQIIPLLIKAAEKMDDIFWIQAYGDKEALLNSISDEYTKKFVMINYGPWERLNNDKPFIESFGKKPDGANFYPVDMTKDEFEKFNDKNKTSQYSIIIRDADKKLKVVPYSVAYKEKISDAVEYMRRALYLAEDEGFKNYMNSRIEALLTDNYQPSDFAWMDMKTSNIDFVVGPIENYEDRLYGYRSAFE